MLFQEIKNIFLCFSCTCTHARMLVYGRYALACVAGAKRGGGGGRGEGEREKGKGKDLRTASSP